MAKGPRSEPKPNGLHRCPGDDAVQEKGVLLPKLMPTLLAPGRVTPHEPRAGAQHEARRGIRSWALRAALAGPSRSSSPWGVLSNTLCSSMPSLV